VDVQLAAVGQVVADDQRHLLHVESLPRLGEAR
jgi:hypothetical protein